MEDLNYPYAVKKVTLSNQVTIAYADEGAGKETLIFVHGLGSYLPAWKKVIDELRQDYRCIAIDLPGYGKSGKGDWTYDMAFFADCIDGLVKKLKIRKASLVGHSMGGQISMTLALRQPKWLQKMVLLAPAGFETFTEQDRTWFGQYVSAPILKATPTEQIERNFHVNFFGAKMPDDARFMYEDRLFMRETREYDHYCGMIPKCVQGMLQQPVYERLGEITKPTLILYGNDDLLIPNRILHPTLKVATVAQSGQQRIPHSQLVMVPQCGHFVLWDGAKTVAASIRTFFSTK
ncbi:alpha/beta hydrolase fold protein [Haliscomenobacter hydrossis DSM 1100]|uniref:Alpha/beta hydrolase fold protein n=2 Tax=Haliscomenobacter TaxID=2349 RepID=F4L6I3_HALH1|nr:alpha/beta hydrolase fold protein [Haliscomenobacter hydrossis DSM 1100]